MTKFLSIIALIAAATVTVCGAKPAPLKVPAKHKAAHEAAAAVTPDDEMIIASVPHINPLEILAPAGEKALGAVREADEMVTDMLGFARKYIGTRYRSGGKAPRTGFDCSGFTSYVYRNFGYELSPSSRAQYGQGHAVKRGEIQPGDLLFFKGRGRRAHGVGHVGIAVSADPVTGEITFIHAAVSGGVRIDRLSAPYYASRYIGARRVLTE